jgi:hypothetical protein
MGRGEAFGLPFLLAGVRRAVPEIVARREEVVAHPWLPLKLPAANYLDSR